MYAGINMQHLIDIGYINHGIHGEVYLWGRLYRHSLGWRAQYAYPKNFIVPPDMVPFSMADIEKRIQTLIDFDVDIYLQVDREARVGGANIPLWMKDYGWSQQGIAHLIDMRKRWYESKPRIRGIAVGDRIATPDGIGIVCQISFDTRQVDDAENVYYVLYNRQLYRIPLKAATWSDRNWRWESSVTGTLTSKDLQSVKTN
jgi:hypothetical protein